MKQSRLQFDLMTALMLMIAVSILVGLNLEPRTVIHHWTEITGQPVDVPKFQYGWPCVCFERISLVGVHVWSLGRCVIDGITALALLAAIVIGRERLLRLRGTNET